MSKWPVFSSDEISLVSSIMKSGKVNYWTGNEGKLFELEFAKYCNTKYSIALSNGTVALELALRSLMLCDGDEIIVTPRSFIASVSAVINVGLKPVFADIDLNSQNITSKSISSVISPKTKAIVCVHLAGWPCDMDPIIEIAKSNNLFVIEDCAQAHGASYKDRPVGSIGDIGCWSFCQDKIISSGGEGGAITTNNYELWKWIWSYKDHGKNYDLVHSDQNNGSFKWVHDSFGSNFRMTEIQAGIARLQLLNLDKWQKIRFSNAVYIWNYFKNVKGLSVPVIPSFVKHAAYRCYVSINEIDLKKEWNRDRVINAIKDQGFDCFSGSCPEIYLERAFDDTGYRPIQNLKNAHILGKNSIAFLVDQTITRSEIERLVRVVEKIMKTAVI